jgi:parvulin-like peptidyl-prolyl isomerase
MSTIVRFGSHQLTAERICQHASKSPLLPQLLRELIIDDVLSQWQPSSSARSIEEEPEFDRCHRQIAATSIDRGLTKSQLHHLVIRAVKLNQFKQKIWGHKLGSYYLGRKTQLDRIICSIMQVTDGTIAQELYFRICSGEQTFSQLAFKYSQGLEALDGGKVGPIHCSKLHPAINSQLIQLEPGQLSPLFTVDNFYIFVRLEQIVPAQFDDELRQSLLDELFEQWLQSKVASEIGLVSVPIDLN